MKILKILLLAFLIISCSTSQSPSTRHYYDETGASVSQETFRKKWGNKENGFARWDVENDTARIIQLSSPLFEQYILSYGPFKSHLEKMTRKKFNDNTIFLLEYVYLDDLCNSSRTNNWSKTEIRERKKFLSPIKAETESKNHQLIFLHFFEEGIGSSNKPDSPKEYFYTDTNNFLRNTIFKNPTLCGSFALIKPNGQVLIRNGENRADLMTEYLKPETWNQLFSEAE